MSLALETPIMFEQLIKLQKQQPELINSVMVRLLNLDQTLRWALIVGAYRDGQISLGKAAELLNLHQLELRERFIEMNIPLRLGPRTLAEARAEIEAIENWFEQHDPAKRLDC